MSTNHRRFNLPFRSLLGRTIRTIKYAGCSRYCPICSRHASRFEQFGIVPRKDAKCVWCGALERHRLVWLFLRGQTELFAPGQTKRMLHVAPERCLEMRLRDLVGKGYLTADLSGEGVDVKMDVCNIGYPDESFDVIYCSHVLEHVAEDRKAMAEFHRVLSRGGWAILLVPITAPKTVEDPSITDPRERLRRFGQEDHVRRYGPDYLERLEAAGFNVSRISPAAFLRKDEIELMGITQAAGDVYLCRK